MTDLPSLEKRIVHCRKCSRLVHYLSEIRGKYPDYWCKPVPAFGDAGAKIMLLGLAPGRFGSNRTGRMFTGDASGNFLYPVLHEVGLASEPVASALDDGLRLQDAMITAIVRCAPPKNKPTPLEIASCRPFWQQEISLLKELRVVVALGKMAHDEYVRFRIKKEGGRLRDYPFRHGAVYRFKETPRVFIDTYHPSRQNTNTGKLTKKMFVSVFRSAVRLSMDQQEIHSR